jgi:acetolactate synthase-1/2/3 large subunit
MNVSEWIVQELIKRGVSHVFTLQGGYSMYLNDAFGHSSCTPVYMLTESGAAFAAAGYAQCTGKLGVCVITSGLAQTNALSGVASAYSDYLPMLVISGDINSDLIKKRDLLNLRQGGQQDVPIIRIASPVTAFCSYLTDPKDTRHMLDMALWFAIEKKGPAWIDIPIDVQQMEFPDEHL